MARALCLHVPRRGGPTLGRPGAAPGPNGGNVGVLLEMRRRAEQGERLDERVVAKVAGDLEASLRRRSTKEGQLAGAAQMLVPWSDRLFAVANSVGEKLAARGSFDRPLYAACARAVTEADDRASTAWLDLALGTDGGGGLASLSAATFSRDPGLSGGLVRVATSRHPQLAFAADVARVVRGESSGEHVASVAPKIKESHRIELCAEIFVPLLRQAKLPKALAPAVAVLRDAERHLGRWLVFGEVATRAGDPTPLAEATERSETGPASARAAWALVAWALGPTSGTSPRHRPTVELVSRLSDRPSADRDTTFLFRLAAAGVDAARPMLEALAKGPVPRTEVGVRAALHLARDYKRSRMQEALSVLAANPKRDALRGIAVAALHDIGLVPDALLIAPQLYESRHLATAVWAALVTASVADGRSAPLVTEVAFRRAQLGWVE